MSDTQPKKSLGQHWLHDTDVLQQIVASVDVQAHDTVVEIGPGLGTLTAELLGTGATVIAIEYDQELLQDLQSKFANRPNFQLVHEDILKFNFSTLPSTYKIVANIPYYLTSQLLRILSDTEHKPHIAALLMQKEVTERVCALPPDMSILSVAVQSEYSAQKGLIVPPEMFTPPPKVDSQVLIIEKSQPIVSADERKAFMQVVKAGFSAKRKTLRNTISGGLHMPKAQASALLEQSHIMPERRAETVTLQEWYTLYTNYKSLTS